MQLTIGAPGRIAPFPRQLIFGEGRKNIKEGPGNDDVVIESNKARHYDHPDAQTWSLIKFKQQKSEDYTC